MTAITTPRMGSLTTAVRESTAMSWAKGRWHAPSVRLYPTRIEDFERDFGRLIRESILPGYAPEAPLLDDSKPIVTLGSCFARELRTSLTGAGVATNFLWVPAGLNNTFALLDFVAWVTTGDETGRGFRYDRYEDGAIREWKPTEERAQYERWFGEAGAFVFTIGLAEVWQDRLTGGVFWRGIPEEIFDADRHAFRLTTVEENAANMTRLVELIRAVNPTAPIVLTLSPVPLMATFRNIACIPADTVSKAVLRVALDRLMDAGHDRVFYWPSFEIVRWAGSHVRWAAFGTDDGKARHVSRYLVDEIVDAFVESFYGAETAQTLRRSPVGKRRRPSRGQSRMRRMVRKTRKRAKASRRLGLALLARASFLP